MDQKAEIQAKMNVDTGLFELKLTDEQYLIGLLSNLELLATKFEIIHNKEEKYKHRKLCIKGIPPMSDPCFSIKTLKLGLYRLLDEKTAVKLIEEEPDKEKAN